MQPPDREIHVILDNLSTHKPKRDMWLARHKNVHFHYTASFRGVDELVAHIDSFIADYNEDAQPFVWTKSKVHQKRLKPCFADQ